MSDFDDEEEPSQKIRSKRVFMNNVDTFMGNILSKVLFLFYVWFLYSFLDHCAGFLGWNKFLESINYDV